MWISLGTRQPLSLSTLETAPINPYHARKWKLLRPTRFQWIFEYFRHNGEMAAMYVVQEQYCVQCPPKKSKKPTARRCKYQGMSLSPIFHPCRLGRIGIGAEASLSSEQKVPGSAWNQGCLLASASETPPAQKMASTWDSTKSQGGDAKTRQCALGEVLQVPNSNFFSMVIAPIDDFDLGRLCMAGQGWRS